MNKTFSLLFFTLLFYASAAQVANYGNVTLAELEEKFCPIDSSASAYYIYDYGDVTFEADEYIERITTRTSRIKILDQSEAAIANVEIYLHNGQYPDVVEELEVTSYNLEIDQTITATHLAKNDLIKDEGSPFFTRISAIAPNVKAGTIIELKYRIRSYTPNIDDWNFQHHVPVLDSEFKIHTVQFYSYVFLAKGVINFKKDTTYLDTKKFIFGQQRLNMAVREWKITNIPAFSMEPFCYAPNNYRSSIKFQLSQSNLPYSAKKDYIGSWESVNELLLKHDNFGFFMLDNKKQIKEIAQNFDTIKDQKLKAKTIVNYVKKNFVWNGQYSLLSTMEMKDFLAKKVGSSADLNLFLCALLNYCEIESYPTAISNRERGILHFEYPFIEQLNNIVVVSLIDNEAQLYDATNDLLPWNFIPFNCLTSYGLVIDKSESANFVPILPVAKSGVQTFTALAYSEQAKGFVGKTKIKLLGYESLESKRDIESNNLGGLRNSIQEHFSDSHIDSLDYSDQTDNLVLTCMIATNVESLYERVLISPILYMPDPINPFTAKTRNLPIDLPYAKSDLHMLQITIPEGYEVEKLPENLSLGLPNKELTVDFSAKIIKNEIQILYKIDIREQIISKELYTDLFKIFKQIEGLYSAKISLIPIKQ